SGAAPSMLELMDGATVAMINAFGDFGLPDDAGALLLVQSDAAGDSAVAELESFQAIAEVQGATEVLFSDHPADSEMFVAARRAVSPATDRYVAGSGGGELGGDGGVRRAGRGEYVAA